MVIVAIAATLDFLIGDPWGWPHPVQAIGWLISRYSQFAFDRCKLPLSRQIAGVGLAIALIPGTALATWAIVKLAYRSHPLVGMAIETILLASCFAGRSLRTAAEDVLAPLDSDDLKTARQKLSLYVGRDTENLSRCEILRALLETVTENAVDGVTAPLFYAIAGAAIPSIGAVPLAIAYKAASTLDSTVGYREEPYTHFGWFSAKLEDLLTWFPCRLTVITLGLLCDRLTRVWSICQRDATKDPSPNAGWSECAYAVILDVQLGGTNRYRGVIKHKPLLNTPTHPITPTTVYRAMLLTRWCFLTWLGIALAFSLIFTQLWS